MAVRFTNLRHFQLPVLGVIGLFVVFAAPTCVKVDSLEPDTISSSPEFAQCVQECNSIAQAARASENDIHRDNIQACDDSRCRQAENLRHRMALQQIQIDRKDCQNECRHNQGGGGGGQ
jgi:hypothetical protein